MIPIRRLVWGIKKTENKIFYSVALMIFFWALYDGVISYVTPILITQRGFTTTQMGLIISTSSIAGAIFDFILGKMFRKTSFLKMFLIVLVICSSYPLILWSATNVFLFIFVMAIWGLYYDIMNFGMFDFLGKHSREDEHSQKSGILAVFKSLGVMIAPLLAGLMITDAIDSKVVIYPILFVGIAGIFYICLHIFLDGERRPDEKIDKKRDYFQLWLSVGRILIPILIFNTVLTIFDATFWTVGPLTSKLFPDFADFGGILMMLYMLPMLFTGWFVEKITSKYGKKRTAFVTFLISCLIMFGFIIFKNPIVLLSIMLLSSVMNSISFPALRGAVVDYISESHKVEKEIEGLLDFSTNIGYVIGPIMAGMMADRFGIMNSFGTIAVGGAVVVMILLAVTPKKINVRV